MYAHFFSFFKIYFKWRLITLQYCSSPCHTSTQISHRCTRLPRPECRSHLAPHRIPWAIPDHSLWVPHLMHATCTGHPFYGNIHVSPKSSLPHPLPRSPKVCSLHLCLPHCPAYISRSGIVWSKCMHIFKMSHILPVVFRKAYSSSILTSHLWCGYISEPSPILDISFVILAIWQMKNNILFWLSWCIFNPPRW